jgi:hypothetical protein
VTRATFLSLFGLGAAGQQMPEPKSIASGNGVRPKPRNGECPCCGTQAPPFRPVPPPMCGDTMIILENGAMSSLCNKEFLPKRTQVECAHCRVIFGQDAEGEK